MIIGIGTDIVHIPRIATILAYKRERFLQRILSPSERKLFEEAPKQAEFLAARFAAKEAAVKAMGTGFRQGVSYLQISVHWEVSGKPTLVFADKAAAIVNQLQMKRAHLTITHEREYALAFVVLENELF